MVVARAAEGVTYGGRSNSYRGPVPTVAVGGRGRRGRRKQVTYPAPPSLPQNKNKIATACAITRYITSSPLCGRRATKPVFQRGPPTSRRPSSAHRPARAGRWGHVLIPYLVLGQPTLSHGSKRGPSRQRACATNGRPEYPVRSGSVRCG